MATPPRAVAAVLGLFVIASPLLAQDPEAALQSGPPAGAPLPACKVFAPSGPFAGTEFDAAAQIGQGPGVLLFVHELTRNTAPMITGLDRLAVQLAWTGLQAHAVRVAPDRTEAELGSKRSSEAMGLHRPIVVSVDGAEGPGGYALDRKATLTLVLANEGKVVRSVAFTDTGRADLQKLRGLVEEVTGPVPTDAAELRKMMEARLTRDPEQLRRLAIDLALLVQRVDSVNEARMQRQRENQQRQQQRQQGGQAEGQMRPNPTKPREGKAPEDEQLRDLLRRCIQRGADSAELDAAFAAIEKRIGDDAGLRKQGVEMFRLMLSLDYGNDDAKARARKFVDQYAGK
ncbi:MAG: hypothetical protein KDC48_03050 [Planctomycetes bacterium]|nr:hypothetical protein [Planctomycetota bacterium]